MKLSMICVAVLVSFNSQAYDPVRTENNCTYEKFCRENLDIARTFVNTELCGQVKCDYAVEPITDAKQIAYIDCEEGLKAYKALVCK